MELSRQFVREVQFIRPAEVAINRYPFSIPAFKNLDRLSFNPGITFFVGENGSGKSTLLEAIAVSLGLNAEGGGRNFKFGTRPSHSELYNYLRLVRGIEKPKDSFFLRAESYFNLATNIEELDNDPNAMGRPIILSYGGKSLHEQSHGESFFSLFVNRLRFAGLYLLDEPEAALSPSRQLSALSSFHQIVKKGAQLIIATHSPILLAYPNATIYQFSQAGINPIEYESTEHYQVTSDFFRQKDKHLKILLADD